MRPRVFPAEDFYNIRSPILGVHRFNEAAGIPRGRQGDLRSAGAARVFASMRPRVFPAEDAGLLLLGMVVIMLQ